MMKKWLCALMCLVVLMLPFAALGAVRMPEKRGNINDSADILSAQTAADLAEFSKQVSKRAGIDLHVVTVHFLDGMDVQLYADRLFTQWGLTGEDVLLVCAAGEDSFALSAGADAQQKLGKTNMENLLYISSDFAQLFLTQQYDAALGSCCMAFNQLLEKQLGKSVRVSGLFANAGLPQTEQTNLYSDGIWTDVMDNINRSGAVLKNTYAEAETEGLGAGGWLVIMLVVLLLARRSQKENGRKERGCGCLSLVGILALLALASLFLF